MAMVVPRSGRGAAAHGSFVVQNIRTLLRDPHGCQFLCLNMFSKEGRHDKEL